jgi:hypothetical protein
VHHNCFFRKRILFQKWGKNLEETKKKKQKKTCNVESKKKKT